MSDGLQVRDLEVTYRRPGGAPVRAVAGVDLDLAPGRVVGLVGESGCGKSTLGRAAVGLEVPSGGRVLFDGAPVVPLGRGTRPVAQRRLQMVFQDPFSSLNPRRRVGGQIGDAVRLAGGSRAAGARRAAELLERVGLDARDADRFPHEFSGGQRQRIAIARALAAEPSCLVADEPISALDASAQAAVANLLVGLARDLDMGLLLISHDLAVVRQVCDEVLVMYLGTVVESGPTGEVWDGARHPYTEALVAAVPRPDGRGVLPAELHGDVPDPAAAPSGCRFHPRCPIAEDRCADTEPRRLPSTADRTVACHVRNPAGPRSQTGTRTGPEPGPESRAPQARAPVAPAPPART